MSRSAISDSNATKLARKPTTPEELLDREEAIAMHTITSGVRRFGDDLCEDTGLRGVVREHPFLVTGLVAAIAGGAGFLAGPSLVRFVASKASSIGSAKSEPAPAPAGAPAAKSGHARLVSVAMRAMRAVMTVPRG